MSVNTKDLLALTEGILAGTSPAKEIVPIGADPVVDDGLKAVKVPDSFVDNVLNFSGRLEEGTTASYVEKPVQYLNEAKVAEDKLMSLVERLTSLIKEARQVMTEMTSAGMIGVGPQTNLLKKKRRKRG
jgi:hypothetical protein